MASRHRRAHSAAAICTAIAILIGVGVLMTASSQVDHPGAHDHPAARISGNALAAPDIHFTMLPDGQSTGSPDPTPSAGLTPSPDVLAPTIPALTTLSPPTPTPSPTPMPTPTPLPSMQPAPDAVIVATHQTDTLGVVIEQLQRDGKTYFIADIRIKDGLQIKNGFANAAFGANFREHTYIIAKRYEDCVFAINGDFYNFHTSGIVLRDGIVYRDASRREDTELLLIGEDGSMSSIPEPDAEIDALLAEGIRNVFSFGPVLVDGGVIDEDVGKKGRANEPRCGIGMYEPGHYLAIVCDGRREEWSEGCTLKQLAELFVERGVTFAYNMDGGGSATMVMYGETVNRPSNGQRSISDILYFSE